MGVFILVVAVVGIVRMARARGASPWLFGGVAVFVWLAASAVSGQLLRAATVQAAPGIRMAMEASAYLAPWVALAFVVLYVRFVPGRKRTQPEGRWSCSTCGWLNAEYALQCEACGAAFLAGLRSPAGPPQDAPQIAPVYEPRDTSASTNRGISTPHVPLKRSRVINIVMISVGTGGLYIPFWYLRRRRGLNALHSPTKIGLRTPVALVGAYAIGVAMPYESLSQSLLLLGAGVTNIWLAFRVRWMLADHLEEKITAVLPNSASVKGQFTPSSVLTFFLTIFYLQYKINRIIDESALWETPVAAAVTLSASAPDVPA